jgi:hypothetical protein
MKKTMLLLVVFAGTDSLVSRNGEPGAPAPPSHWSYLFCCHGFPPVLGSYQQKCDCILRRNILVAGLYLLG